MSFSCLKSILTLLLVFSLQACSGIDAKSSSVSQNPEAPKNPKTPIIIPDDFEPLVLEYQITSPATLRLPARAGVDYDFRVNWGDGNEPERITQTITNSLTHSYLEAGTYQIRIYGLFDTLYDSCNQNNDVDLLSVSFGDVQFINLNSAFKGCSNITFLTDVDVSNVIDMSSMFSSARINSLNVSNWNTQNVQNMSLMFSNSIISSIDVSNWNTSNVTSMRGMFASSSFESLDTGSWDTSKVLDMSSMFASMTNLTSLDVSMWDTEKVTNMSSMFRNLSNSETIVVNVRDWDTSNVKNMSSMFSGVEFLNPDVSMWDTSSVTNMFAMFRGTEVANPDVSMWDTSKVENMSLMFSNVEAANPDVSMWDTSSVTNMDNMFSLNSISNPDVSMWDTSNVTNMTSLFDSSAASPNVSNWNTSSLQSMAFMFSGAPNANPDFSNWDFSAISTISGAALRFALSASNISNVNYSNFLIQLQSTISHSEALEIGDVPASYQQNSSSARSALLGLNYTISDQGAE